VAESVLAFVVGDQSLQHIVQLPTKLYLALKLLCLIIDERFHDAADLSQISASRVGLVSACMQNWIVRSRSTHYKHT